MSRNKVILTATVGVLVMLILAAWSPWDTLRYSGDGKLSDQGFLSYPRYRITLSDIPLNQSSENHFRFRHLPSDEMSLVLGVRNRRIESVADRAPLERLPVTIEALLADEKGQISCRASGRPGSFNEDANWVLTSGAGVDASYWHHACIFFKIHSNRTYDLTIRVTDVGPGMEKVVVIPELTGGGQELP